jgi:pseudoazurin
MRSPGSCEEHSLGNLGMRSSALTRGLVVLGSAALAACSGAGSQPSQEQTRPVETYGEVEANGHVIEIRMYTEDPDGSGALHVFKPRLVKAKVGDTISFLPTEPTHLSASIHGMVPDGAEGWEGVLNEPVSYVIPKAGVYGYKCTPHYGAGMVGLIVVDGGENVATAKSQRHPGRANREFADLFAEAGL